MSAICPDMLCTHLCYLCPMLKQIAVLFITISQLFAGECQILEILRIADKEDLDSIAFEHIASLKTEFLNSKKPDSSSYYLAFEAFQQNCLSLQNAYLSELMDYHNLSRIMQMVEVNKTDAQKRHRPKLLKLQNSKFHEIKIYGLITEALYFCPQQNIGRRQELLLRACNMAIKYNLEKSSAYNIVTLNLVDLYYLFDDFPNIIKYSQIQSKSHFITADHKFMCYNKLGFCYTLINEYEKALDCFFNILHTSDRLKITNYNEAWKYIAHGNIGRILLDQKKYQQAAYHLALDFQYSCSNEIWDCGIPSGTRLMKIYNETREFNKSQEVFDQLSKVALHGSNTIKFDYYKTVAEYLKKVGRIEQSNLYFDSAIQAQFAMQKEHEIRQLTLNKNKNQVEKYLSELEMANENISLKNKIRNILIVLLLLFIAVSVFVFYSLKASSKRKKEILELELQLANVAKSNLESENNKIKSRLDSVIQDLREKSLKIEKYETRFSHKKDEKYTETLTKMHLSTEENWHKFRQQFKTIHPSFIQEISQELPKITAGEIRYLCLLKLSLEPFEIANLLGIGKESVQKIKQRIKNKIDPERALQISKLIN